MRMREKEREGERRRKKEKEKRVAALARNAWEGISWLVKNNLGLQSPSFQLSILPSSTYIDIPYPMSLSTQCRGGAVAHRGTCSFNRHQLNSKRNPALKPPALLPFRTNSLTMNECNNAGRTLFAPSPFGGPPRSLARVSRQPAVANSAKGPRQADGYQLLPIDIAKYHLGLLRRSSSLLKSCTLRRGRRLLHTFLDSHSHFDAQRVISRVVYNAEERSSACSEAAGKVVRRWVFSGYLAHPLCPDSALTRAAVRFARSLARSPGTPSRTRTIRACSPRRLAQSTTRGR